MGWRTDDPRSAAEALHRADVMDFCTRRHEFLAEDCRTGGERQTPIRRDQRGRQPDLRRRLRKRAPAAVGDGALWHVSSGKRGVHLTLRFRPVYPGLLWL